MRQIARSQNLSTGVVSKYIQRAQEHGLSWPLPDELSDQALLTKLQPPRQRNTTISLAEPDFSRLQKELTHKGMTILLAWEEYAQAHPHHYSYAHYSRLFRLWRAKQKLSMRQIHVAGEKLFIDYCGPTMSVVNPRTGEVRSAQVFVAVMGASSYTYAEATWSQGLCDWLEAHARAFTFLGGVPAVVVPDNLKSAVSKACRQS